MTAIPLSDLRETIISEARDWAGTPYLHQASLKGVGCDCLGLVRGIWRTVYDCEPQPVPAYTPDWAEAGNVENLIEAAARHMDEIPSEKFDRADLLIFRWRPGVPAKHLAIATSKTTMIHAQQGAVVCEVAISPWWQRHIAAAFSFPLPDQSFQEGPA